MKVWMVYEQEYAEYNDAYCARLFEQFKAVPAGKAMDIVQSRFWLGSLKVCMEEAEERRRREAQAASLDDD